MFSNYHRYVLLFILLSIAYLSCNTENSNNNQADKDDIEVDGNNQKSSEYAIIIHGGAGTILKKNISEDKEKDIRKTLQEALQIGEAILKDGGNSIDAVEKTINHLEDSPFFNAGKGAVFTHDGKNELDASIMVGSTMDAGAVGGVTTVKNPISAARAVMEKSEHVMLVGRGAEEFSKSAGLTLVDPSYFSTEARKESLRRAIDQEKLKDDKFGTVGCVALDKSGNIVAGTSTGGMTNKRYNRIGDSPIIGAGTYADKNCGISCTGHGEFFIRYTVARDIAALVEYKSMSLDDAAEYMVNEKLKNIGAAGGVIALDKYGNVSLPFNTEGMYRGYIKSGEEPVIALYKE